jgi:hypothetical protein
MGDCVYSVKNMFVILDSNLKLDRTIFPCAACLFRYDNVLVVGRDVSRGSLR